MNVSDYIFEFLERKGVEHIFTVSGGGSIFLCDALARAKKMKYICNHHEQASGFSAEAYARARNHVGVTLVTSGPGATNALTACAASWHDHIPHIFISGQAFYNQTIAAHPGPRQIGGQEVDIVNIVRPITKYAQIMKSPAHVYECLNLAWDLATKDRPGPVWLDIPGDVQNARLPSELVSTRYTQHVTIGIRHAAVQVAGLLRNAKRPLIHLGNGARGTRFELLVEYQNIPFVTARNANDLVGSDHPLCIGRPGTFAQRGACFAVQLCDVYLAIGTRLSLFQTGYNSKDYARNAKIIQVDIDQAELDKGTLRDPMKICADSGDFINELIDALSWWGGPLHCADWVKRCQDLRDRYPVVLPEYAEHKGSVNAYHFIDVLSDLLTPDDIIVTDMGFAFQNTHQAFRVKKGQRLITNCGLAPMGWGLPAAIGAAIGTSRRVICITGEGGLMMNIQELATVAHHNLPIKIFVLNNGGYLTIKQTQELGFEGRLMGVNHDTGLSFPNFGELAWSHRIRTGHIWEHQGIETRIREVLDGNYPVLCEITMDPNQVQAPRAINRRNPDGTMNPTALEDAFPYLPPEEIAEVMNGE